MTSDAHGIALDIGAEYLLGGRLVLTPAGDPVVLLASGRALRIDPADLVQVGRVPSNPAVAALAMGSFRITGLADPVGLQDAATAQWSIAAFPLLAQNGLDFPDKAAVRSNIGLGDVATRNVGSTAGTAASGDDARFVPVTQQTRLKLRRLLVPELLAPGWTSAASGSGTLWYSQSPQYEASQRAAPPLLSFVLDTGTTGTGTNARVAYQSQVGRHWLCDEHRSIIRTFATGPSAISIARVGWWANAATPAATGQPAYGEWLESDAATHGDSDWRACAANGGAVTVELTGIAFDGTDRPWLFDRETTSSLKVWDLRTSSVSPVATITSGLASGNTQRTATAFGQILRANGAGSNGKLWLVDFGIVEVDGGVGYELPA